MNKEYFFVLELYKFQYIFVSALYELLSENEDGGGKSDISFWKYNVEHTEGNTRNKDVRVLIIH